MSRDSWPILSTECVNDWHPECRIDGCICDCHAATAPAVLVAPVPLPKATSSRERVYAELIAYQQRHGFPPTVRELGELVGLTSPSSVHYHLKMLGESGLISNRRGQPRTAIPTSTAAPA